MSSAEAPVVDAGAAAAEPTEAAAAAPTAASEAPKSPPPRASVKPKSSPGHGDKCQIIIGKLLDGSDMLCPTRLVAKKISIATNVLTWPFSLYADRDNKHHCRHCLKRICTE